MRYRFTYRTKASDLWQLSMYYTYGSLVGVCNIIFTMAAILLTIKQWEVADISYRFLLLLGCCLFSIIQPLLVWFRAKKQVKTIIHEIELGFDDSYIYVKSGDESSELSWRTIKKISKKPTMIIIFSNTTHGFVLTNRVLGGQKEAFYSYVSSKISR